jgi:hypothetical protein
MASPLRAASPIADALHPPTRTKKAGAPEDPRRKDARGRAQKVSPSWSAKVFIVPSWSHRYGSRSS